MLETTPAAQSSLLTRTIQREIEQESPVRAVLIFGPRRIGKTTLLRQIIGQNGCRWFNGDIEGSAADLRFQSQGDVFNVLSQAPNIVIDEAHKIADIGTIVKVLVDANETLQNPCRIYLTSSSSFYLSTLKESALGRVVSRKMWPFSLYELAQRISWGTVNTYLERFLVYGLMPMVCLEPEKRVHIWKTIAKAICFEISTNKSLSSILKLCERFWYVWPTTSVRKSPMTDWLKKSESVATLLKTMLNACKHAQSSRFVSPFLATLQTR